MRRRTSVILFVTLAGTAISCCLFCRTRISMPRDFVEEGGWAMVGGDAGHRGFSAERIYLPLQLQWRYRAGGPIISSPVIVDEMVCLGALDRRFYFLSAVSGKEYGLYKMDSGVSATAAIGKGTVYFATETGDGIVYALNLGDGSIRWKVPVGSVSTALTYHRGRVLVGTNEGHFTCLAASDGAQMWQFVTQGQMSSAAAVTGQMAIIGCDDGYLYAVGLEDGQQRWRRELEGAVWSGPVVSDQTVYVGTFAGYLYSLRATDGDIIWTHRMDGSITCSPAVGSEAVYVGSDEGVVVALRTQDGELQWSYRLPDARPGPPLVADDVLFLGASDGQILALDANSGQPQWSYQTSRAIVSSPALWRGRLFIGSMDGYLYVFGSQKPDSTRAAPSL